MCKATSFNVPASFAVLLAMTAACRQEPTASTGSEADYAPAASPAAPNAPASLTAATSNPVPDETGPYAPHRFASWAGRWTGVEGMYVDITPTEPEHYRLNMQSDLDTHGVYEGHDSEHGIKFTRKDQPFSLHRTSGKETGLKYLAEKQTCLTVKTGEGYCRD